MPMFRCLPMMAAVIALTVSGTAALAQEDTNSESAVVLDETLRTKGAAMPVTTLDGSAMESPASHAYLMDMDTGAVLMEKAGSATMYPSSMTKIMTLYVLFERLTQGALSLDSQFTVSEKAWRMQGSKMFVPLGAQIGLEDLIRGIAIQSGNDACIVVAEGIAGSEEAFAKIMNDTASKLGMSGTHFTDATGWPHPEHVTTARDLAILGRAITNDFPKYHHYHSEREFTFHGIRQFNRNLLLGNPSLKVDGLKTGHTEAAGYGIVLTATDPASSRRQVLVINGLDSEAARAQEGERLLKWGFANFHNVASFSKGAEIFKAPVWMGSLREMPLTVSESVQVTAPKSGHAAIKAKVTFASPLIAPVVAGQEVGTLTVTDAAGISREVPLIAAAEASRLGFVARIPRALGF
jgi:D-alanyl-D-alanine carboxypeptidase (penicillin-binding protein 5/6)